MAHPLPNEECAMACGSRMTPAILLLVLFSFLFLLYPQILHAQDNDVVLPESGIHYPGGFDTNTVGVVKGKVYAISYKDKGPVLFRLDSEKESYFIIASPLWYWKDLGANISDGTEIKIHGSKSLGKDGKLYIVAQEMEIVSSGKIYAFRDDGGYPLWKGSASGTRAGGGGFGSSNRMGGQAGGMGKGRR
jgi:hypothetical protein